MIYLRLLRNTVISSLRFTSSLLMIFRYLLKICLHYNYEIRALHHSKVFIQNITGNSHYAMNESKKIFLII